MHSSVGAAGVQHPAFTEAEGMAEDQGQMLAAKPAQQRPLEQDWGCHWEVWQVTGLAELEFKPSTACKCRGKSQRHIRHTRFCPTSRCVWSPPFESTAIFPHTRRGSPIFSGCCAPGEVLFSVSLLHVLWPCCNSHPATISSSVTTPSSACCSLDYFHSRLSPCSHHLLKTSLDAAVPPHHLYCFVSCFWEELKMDEPKLFSVVPLEVWGLSEGKTDPGSLNPHIHQNTALSNKKNTTPERYVTYCYFINNAAYNCFK